MKIKILNSITVLLFFILGLCIGQLINLNEEISLSKEISLGEQEIIDDCSNLSLKKTAYCLRDNIKTFFKYRLNDDSNSLNFEEIKESGGDCRDWAQLYERLLDSLNFENERIVVPVINGRTAHTFIIASNSEGYMVLDQTNAYVSEYSILDNGPLSGKDFFNLTGKDLKWFKN